MSDTIWAAIIPSVLALLGVIITNMMGNRKIETKLETGMAVMEEKVDNLKEEVRKHNSFAERIPVMEEQIKVANHRFADLEQAQKSKPVTNYKL